MSTVNDNDKIISYHQMCGDEKMALQRGMNFSNGQRSYSVLLMNRGKSAVYADAFDKSGNLIYEGHDVNKKAGIDPKVIDQPMQTPKGTWTENGKFFKAATDFKSGLLKSPELVKVYEKIVNGVWSVKGMFQLVDVKIQNDGKRNVFKFHLKPVETKLFNMHIRELPHNRLIPSEVKLKVWQRDRGECVKCHSSDNLHYDHDLPFSKGGTSLTEDNIRLLCAACNLKKGAKIEVFVMAIMG